MKHIFIIALLIFLVACSAPVVEEQIEEVEQPQIQEEPKVEEPVIQEEKMQAGDYSTPEKTIATLETELQKGNVDLQLEKTHFSDYFKDNLPVSLDEFNTMSKEGLKEDVKNLEIESIDFSETINIDRTHAYLIYIVHYTDGSSSEEQDSYFIRVGDEWLIDVEAEFVSEGLMKAPMPTMPANTFDCGFEETSSETNFEMANCFYAAYQACEPAMMTMAFFTDEDNLIEDTFWIDSSCKVHIYTDSEDEASLIGQFYMICSDVTFDILEEDGQELPLISYDMANCEAASPMYDSYTNYI